MGKGFPLYYFLKIYYRATPLQSFILFFPQASLNPLPLGAKPKIWVLLRSLQPLGYMPVRYATYIQNTF